MTPTLAVRELEKLLRFASERPGAAVCCPIMEARADERQRFRAEIRKRIKALTPTTPKTP